MTLTGRLRADIDVDIAVIGEADFRPLGRIAHRDLEIVGEADAAKPALPRGIRAPGREAGVVHLRQRRIQHHREVAGVVGLADGRRVRHRRWRHHVAPAQLRAVDIELARGGVDQPFEQIVALGTPCATIGVHRHRVGEHAEHVGMDLLEVVDAGEHGAAGQRRDVRRERRKIGAHVGEVARAQREEFSVRVDRQLAQRDVVAAMRVGQERLAALRCPLHRPPQLARRIAGQHMFGVEEQPSCRSRRRHRA